MNITFTRDVQGRTDSTETNTTRSPCVMWFRLRENETSMQYR